MILGLIYLAADGAQLEDQLRSVCSLEIFSFELGREELSYGSRETSRFDKVL
jgi:hypothetical protein